MPRVVNGFTYGTVEREGRSPETVVHPAGYTGKGGELAITLGLHSDFAAMEEKVSFSARHVAAVWTHLLVWEENLGPSLEVPKVVGTDFFGTLMHEFGHALGLAHPTALNQGGAPGKEKFATAKPGPNGRLDLDAGPDGIRGSSDDRRGDDVNVVFFKKADNNPFTLPKNGVIDSTSYSRNPAELPPASIAVNVPSREVAREVFDLPATEGMMVSGGSLTPGLVRRGLGADDVAGIRYAMSGLDEIEGTADDYTLRIEYVGVDDAADVVIRFDLQEGYAVATLATVPISGHHVAMQRRRVIRYNPNLAEQRVWYFPRPVPVRAAAQSINARVVSLRIETKPGRRYGVTWPGGGLMPENARKIVVQLGEVSRGPMSDRLFVFTAAESTTEVQLTFPSAVPAPALLETFEWAADPMED